MVNHCNKQIEKEFAAALHLVLHRTTALEGMSCSNDKCKIVRSKLRVVIGCVGVSKASRGQDGRALDAGLKTLLLQSEFLQFLKSVLFSLTVDNSVLQDWSGSGVDNGFVNTVAVTTIFKVPAVALLVILHAGVVVAFVQVFKD